MEKGDRLDARDVETHLCVMVLMLQAANRQTQETLRMFRDRGDVHGFFPPEGDQAAHAAELKAVPNLDGYQATGIIRASDRPDAGVPIIAMTANAFVEDRQRAREAGMTEHLAKPLDQAMLVRTLQNPKDS